MDKIREQIERLRQYNPPDRAIDGQRQIAVDIQAAADTMEAMLKVVEAAQNILPAFASTPQERDLMEALANLKGEGV